MTSNEVTALITGAAAVLGVLAGGLATLVATFRAEATQSKREQRALDRADAAQRRSFRIEALEQSQVALLALYAAVLTTVSGLFPGVTGLPADRVADINVRRAEAIRSIAAVLCAVALGIALKAVARTFQQLNAVGFLGGTLFSAIGGAFVPLTGLPGWARTISSRRTTGRCVATARFCSTARERVLVLLIYTAACAMVALARFRFDDTKAGWA